LCQVCGITPEYDRTESWYIDEAQWVKKQAKTFPSTCLPTVYRNISVARKELFLWPWVWSEFDYITHDS